MDERQEFGEARKKRTIFESLNQALDHQRLGRLEAAEAIYKAVLDVDSNNPDAWHLLGMLAHHTGQHEAALAHIAKAIQIKPDVAPFHNNLGNVLQALKRTQQARLCFEHALQLAPDYPEAHINLGNTLHDLKWFEEALRHYQRGIELNPNCPEAYNNLGNTLLALGHLPEAAASFQQALSLNPNYALGYMNLAGVFKSQKRFDKAAACCLEAIRCEPGLAEAYGNLGAILIHLEQFDEAESCCREALRRKPALPEPYVILALIFQHQNQSSEAAACARQALALRPDYAEAYNNLGNALEEQGYLDDAITCYCEALRLKPGLAEAHYNFGNALRAQLRFEEACACYDQTLRLDSGHVKAHWNRALTRLSMGDFEHGWEEFEWRWKKKDTPPRHSSRPLWDGSPLDGRAILLHAEQGLGDTIHFIRYASLVKRTEVTVIFECPPKLVPLLASVQGVDQIVPAGSSLPNFDVHIPLLSLPRIFGSNLANVPARIPYLVVDRAFLNRWNERLSHVKAYRVGLVWAGNPQHAHDKNRSVTLDTFAPLAGISGIAWFGLQHGPRACQALAPPPGLDLIDLANDIGDFRDAAAAIQSFDLVISVDTSIAHLAGALGKPVWLLLPFLPDWRWLTGREDTPWYPATRLFRQERSGDWDTVIERVKKTLLTARERGGAILIDSP